MTTHALLPDTTAALAGPQDRDAGPDWRLAYLITGDRQVARTIAAQVRAHVELGHDLSAGQRGALVAALARREANGPPHGDRLWVALRRLPRRRRAEILARLR